MSKGKGRSSRAQGSNITSLLKKDLNKVSFHLENLENEEQIKSKERST